MPMTLREQVETLLDHKKTTPAQRDQAHAQWLETPESIVEIIQNYRLAIPPSQRTQDDNRDILMQQLRLMRAQQIAERSQ